MQIELDAATVARIQKQAEEAALQQLTAQILANIDKKQMASEVKNLVASKLAQTLAENVLAAGTLDEAVKRASESAEARINKRLADLLTKGVTIRFSGEA